MDQTLNTFAGYNYPMPIYKRTVNWIVKSVFRATCCIHAEQISAVPMEGPLIMAVNHINFLETPVLVTHLLPRRATALAKIETWNSVLAPLFVMWEAIPIRRGEADLSAFRKAQEALADKKLVGIAPEGTRSGDGRLGKGLPGIVLLAQRTGSPIIPIACWGYEDYWKNLTHFRRSDFFIAVGKPFKLKLSSGTLSKDVREQVTQEIMYQISALLPESHRGLYADMEKMTTEFLNFEI
jgi:1-acyl-sn-glycerol-3-phosphate acyltransferase